MGINIEVVKKTLCGSVEGSEDCFQAFDKIEAEIKRFCANPPEGAARCHEERWSKSNFDQAPPLRTTLSGSTVADYGSIFSDERIQTLHEALTAAAAKGNREIQKNLNEANEYIHKVENIGTAIQGADLGLRESWNLEEFASMTRTARTNVDSILGYTLEESATRLKFAQKMFFDLLGTDAGLWACGELGICTTAMETITGVALQNLHCSTRQATRVTHKYQGQALRVTTECDENRTEKK